MNMSITLELLTLALFAALVVAAMLWGARQKRMRRAAHEEAEARRDALPDASDASDTPDSPATPDRTTEAASLPLAPAPAPATAPATASDLAQIKGLGPKLAARLAELGVTGIDQIAALTTAEADALDAQLGTFRGRIARDRWIEQARLLAAGDRAGYEAQFGKL